MTSPTQPDLAEGAPRDEPEPSRGDGDGQSSEQPAEGADDTPAGGDGAARG